jgi:hypothetical protein
MLVMGRAVTIDLLGFNVRHALSSVAVVLLPSKMNLLLHSLNGLVSKRFVFKHCAHKSVINAL